MNNVNVYHWLINMSIKKFVLLITVFYTAINVLFASVYYIAGVENFGGVVSNSKIDNYLDLVFFRLANHYYSGLRTCLSNRQFR